MLFVRLSPAKNGAAAARWFSPMGKLCVPALAFSAAFQGWVLVESVPGLVGTACGWMVVVKLLLFAVLLGFAWANRYRLAPALLRDNPEIAKAALVRSVAVQTAFGVAIVFAAAVLSNLPPSMHVQPVWPFADRFTLDTLGEDPEFRDEVVRAAAALAAAAGLIVVAVVVRRRVWWATAAAAAAIAWFAIHHLDLLFVPAYPVDQLGQHVGFCRLLSCFQYRGTSLGGRHRATELPQRFGGRNGQFAPRVKARLLLAMAWRDTRLVAGIQHEHDTVDGGNVGR
jgi:hypothetical protein